MEETTHDDGAVPGGHLVGRFYAWWCGDPLPPVASPSGLTAAPSDDASLAAAATGMDVEEVRERMQRGHRPWIARVGGEVAGWGWVATRQAGISELGIEITLQPDERYLWDFVTPPAWRGRGVYTALLHAILAGEGADRYWIGHDEGNTPSARGIEKVGFREVGTARCLADGRIAFAPDGPADRAAAAAELLGLPVVES